MLRSKLFDGLKRISTPFRTRNHHRDGARRQRGFRRPRLECLERRELLSVAGWVTSATSPNIGANDLAADLEGNVYVTGSFRDIADFAPGVTIPGDPDILTNSGDGFEVFAAKYRPDGSLDWVSGLNSDNTIDSFIAVEIVGDETAPDNIYVVAEDGDLWKLNGDDGSLIRFDDDNSSITLSDIAVDSATGDIFVTGLFSGTISTSDTVSGGTIAVTSTGNYDVYVAKANSDGLFYWIQHKGARRTASGGDSIAVDTSGNVYVTGHLNDKKGGGSMNTRGVSDVFVSKLDSTDGSFMWIKRAGGDSDHAVKSGDIGYEIIVDNGGVYVTGALGPSASPADFGSFQIDISGENVARYGFVTKLNDATGEFLWATRFGDDGEADLNSGGSLDFDSTGKLHLGGTSTQASTFGAFNLPDQSGPSHGFWATMNADTGEFESVQRVGTSGNKGADKLAFDPNDNLFMAGYLHGLDQEFLTGDVLSSTLDEYGYPNFNMVVVKLFADDPNNNDPTADAGGPYTGTEDIVITFDASLSGDIDGDALSYRWDFGDGTTAITTSPTIDHTYEWGDTFAVSVTVSDGRGGTASAGTSATVTEVNDVPIADAGGAYSGVENEIVTFDASASTDFDNQDGTAANDQTLTYLWDFGDDNTVSTTSPTVDHTYAATGTYDVSLKVNDGLVDSPVAMTTATVSPVGQPEVYDSTDTPLAIADAHPKKGPKTTTSELVISSGDTVGSLGLVVSLDDGSSDVGDLTATLTSPNNTSQTVPLASGTTTYADFGFAGESLGGTWTLAITDSVKGNTHTLNSWSLIVNPTTPLFTEAATGVDQALLAWMESDSSDDDGTDPLTASLVDDLALMLVE